MGSEHLSGRLSAARWRMMEGEVEARREDVAEGEVKSTETYSTFGMFPDREKHVPMRRMEGLDPKVEAREDAVDRPRSPVAPVMRIVVIAVSIG